MGLPRSDIRRIFAFAMAAGLGLGVLVYSFVRLVESSAAAPRTLTETLGLALLVGVGFGLTCVLAVKLTLRQVARDLHTFANELTDTALPALSQFGADDVIAMRQTLGTALSSVPRSEALPRLARELSMAYDPETALGLTATELARYLPIEGAVLLTLDAERDVLLPAGAWGLARLDVGVALDLEATAIGRALSENRETTYSGLQVYELLPLQPGPELLTLFCLPQHVRGLPFATLCLVASGAEVRLGEEQRIFARAAADLLVLAVQSCIHRRLFTRESERMLAFEQLGGLLSGSQRLEQALEQVLRVAARATDSAHGTLLLLEHDESRIRYRVTLKEGDVLPLSVTAQPILRHGLAGWALRERRADIIDDTERDARWLPVPGLDAMRAVLVVPLLYGERALGVLTLADTTPRHYSRRSLALCSALAAYAVTILARGQYEEMIAPGNATLARLLFTGHISPAALTELLSDSAALQNALGAQSRTLVVIHAALRGLERVELEPAALVEHVLSPCIVALTTIAHEHHGYLSVCDNGALVLVFGFPALAGDMRIGAMRAAQAVQAAARRLRSRWRHGFGLDLALSAGVAAGPLVTGMVGGPGFQTLSLTGTPLSDAARIQRLARPDEVLVADSLASSFGADSLFPLERLAPLTMAEGEQPRSVYRLAPGR